MSSGAVDVADQKTVTFECKPIEGGPDGAQVAVITLNRPDKYNPLDWESVLEIERSLQAADATEGVRAVLITGNGRAFSAGGDLTRYLTLQSDPVLFPQFMDDVHRMFASIAGMRVPVVALVNGVTAAGGLELVLSCDFAVAAESAKMGDAHQTYGMMGGGGVLILLPALIGPSRARQLIFSGRHLAAEEALEWGLVTHVVPDDELLTFGLDFAAEVATKSPLAMANAKDVLNGALRDRLHLTAGLRLEREMATRYCLTAKDAQEGLRAFAEKRRPNFVGG